MPQRAWLIPFMEVAGNPWERVRQDEEATANSKVFIIIKLITLKSGASDSGCPSISDPGCL